MVSKKQGDFFLNSVLKTAEIVKGFVGNDLEKINLQVASILEDFAEKTGTKIVLNLSDDGQLSSTIFDLKSDYIRTRFNTDKSMLSLRSKLCGVPIDVKVVKDDVSFSNKMVADSLMELSKVVAGMPFEMNLHGQDDWLREVGGMPKSRLGDQINETFVDELPDDEDLSVEDQELSGIIHNVPIQRPIEDSDPSELLFDLQQ